MNAVLKKLWESASDAGTFVLSLAESGVKSVSDAICGLRIFGSITAMEADDAECDESHYLLVPVSGAGGELEYAVYTKRVLPCGIGLENSLPKVRIFHVPDRAAAGTLERKLISQMTARSLAGVDPAELGSEFADTLERIADQVDRESSRISGGLLLIGGAVAVANPLLGVGIAAKALLPSLGATASRAGVDLVAGRLRRWQKEKVESRVRKEAESTVRRLKPVVFENPVLRGIAALLSDPGGDYDPFVDRRTWPDAFDPRRYFPITAEAVREVLPPESMEADSLTGKWIRHLGEVGKISAGELAEAAAQR